MAIREYIRLKLEVSRDHPQASKLFCLEILQGAAAADGRTDRGSESAGRRKIGDSLRLDRPRQAGAGRSTAFNLYDLATTQHYADFATQVEAVTGATLQDALF